MAREIGSRTTDGCCSGRVTVSTRSTANPGSTARSKRPASRARFTGFNAHSVPDGSRRQSRSAGHDDRRVGRPRRREADHRASGRASRSSGRYGNLLPVERLDPSLVNSRVNRSTLVTVRQAKYLVSARLIGRQIRVSFRQVTISSSSWRNGAVLLRSLITFQICNVYSETDRHRTIGGAERTGARWTRRG